ncbi:S41 family peptidase [Falsibacillus pallidus]|uniref:C-terminal processing peptidase n=1 Tax=Falsibacillus pallidus TaxID=493781 RepID=A0A370GCU5_9BACI|nr:S41 family peptidase [Falsibacillus pallidus]RDI41006.1 carboxyl-terminal processing protease [Falsibacillus pallidus]
MNRKWLAIWTSCCLLIGAGGAYGGLMLAGYEKTGSPAAKEEKKTEKKAVGKDLTANAEWGKLEQAYNLILDRYVQKVEPDQLIQGAITGMVETLKDPYSVYMDAKTAAQFNDSLSSSFEGIGAEITMQDGKIMIMSPFKNSPAEKAGLKAKDQILKVNGESVEGLDLYEATLKIRGKKGTEVKLEIAREGAAQPLNISVKRDEIPVETVHAKMKKEDGKQIGYIEITSFAEHTAEDFSEALKGLEEKKIDGLILDVRGNPGGFLSSVEAILKQFVTDTKPYVQIEERNGEKLRYFSTLKKSKPYPIVVLVDKGSASAAEILAGALKEAEGYTLVGEKTFGKGTVQQAVSMKDGSNIKLTMYKWLTPNGNWIHHKGIEPNITVRQPEYFSAHPLQIEEPLKLDMNSEQVKNAQEMLQGLGYGPGRIDGYYSQQTQKAVAAFQIQNKLRDTGVLDEKTARLLEKKIADAMQKDDNDIQLQAALRIITK